jgi:hypothetical protein
MDCVQIFDNIPLIIVLTQTLASSLFINLHFGENSPYKITSNAIGSKTLQTYVLFDVKRNIGRLHLLRTNLGMNVVYQIKNLKAQHNIFGTPGLWNTDVCPHFDAAAQPRVLYSFTNQIDRLICELLSLLNCDILM